MTSFDNKYQNALREAIVFSIFSFVKNRSCVTQICITKIAAKCILVVVHVIMYRCPIAKKYTCSSFVECDTSLERTDTSDAFQLDLPSALLNAKLLFRLSRY